MSRGKDLLKNTGILFIAKTSTQIVSFFLLPLYTALLSTEQYGQLDIYSSLVMIVLPIVTLQIEQAIFRFLVGKEDDQTRTTVISSAAITLLLSTIIITVIYIILAAVLKFEYSTPLYFYYFAMMLSAVLYQVCRGFGQNATYGFATFLISLTTILLNILFIAVFHMGVLGVIISTSFAHFLGSTYMFIRTKSYKYIRFGSADKGLSKELLVYSVPLIFNQISSWAINYSDRVIILNYLGIGINGIYSVSNKFSNILIAFFNVFNLAWTENVVKNIDDSDVSKYANKIISLTATTYFIIITGIVNLLPFLFNIFVNPKFADAYNHVPILLAAAAFSGIAASLGSVYVAYKKTKNVGITTMLAGVINIVVHLAFINFIGLYAASISTVVSFFALFVYRYINIQSFFKIKVDWKQVTPGVVIFVVSSVAYYLRNNPLIILGFVINIAHIMFLLKRNKHDLINLVKRK